MKVERFLIIIAVAAAFAIYGCDSQSTKDKTADTTQQVKDASRDAAVKAKEGARQAGKDIKAMAEGVKEGWNEDKNAIDLNSATPQQLTALGLSQKQASRVVANRPYKNRHELVTKGVLSEMEYKDIETKVTTK